MKKFSRRDFLFTTAVLPMMVGANQPSDAGLIAALARLAELERDFGGRLGVFALNTATSAQLQHRAGERFAMCSTFKLMLVAAILAQSQTVPGLLEQRIRYAESDLVSYSPITEKHVQAGMTVAALCAAGLQYSDNTAANLLVKLAGGPAEVTRYARSLGDREFRLDRWEPELNTAIPGDLRDTTTPEAMGLSLKQLLLGDVLVPHQREMLREWMLGNTTGAARIRADVPAAWQVGDKTGSGDYGTANDVAVIWPPRRSPVILAIYTTQAMASATARNDVIAAAARIVMEWLE